MNESKPQFHSLRARPGKLRFAQMLETERAAGRLNAFESCTNCSNRPTAAGNQYRTIPADKPGEFSVVKLSDPRNQACQTTVNIFKAVKTNSNQSIDQRTSYE